MAPAIAGAVSFRSRPSAASPLPARAQQGQLKAPHRISRSRQDCSSITDSYRNRSGGQGYVTGTRWIKLVVGSIDPAH